MQYSTELIEKHLAEVYLTYALFKIDVLYNKNSNFFKSKFTIKCFHAIQILSTDTTVTIRLLLYHHDILGNEAAETLTKRVSKAFQPLQGDHSGQAQISGQEIGQRVEIFNVNVRAHVTSNLHNIIKESTETKNH